MCIKWIIRVAYLDKRYVFKQRKNPENYVAAQQIRDSDADDTGIIPLKIIQPRLTPFPASYELFP